MENEKLVIPTLDEIQEYRIVVTTLVTSRTLFLLGLRPGHFSHIIIDEAAQVHFKLKWRHRAQHVYDIYIYISHSCLL